MKRRGQRIERMERISQRMKRIKRITLWLLMGFRFSRTDSEKTQTVKKVR